MITKFPFFIAMFLIFAIPEVFSAQELKSTAYGGEVTFLKQKLSINVEIAKTETEKAKGLMYRKNLAENNGMLFVYEQESILSIWMKNTLIPLDIVFVSVQGVIVSILKDMKPCLKSPCQIYKSKEIAKYILEINAGLIDKKGIHVGQRLIFDLIQN